MVGVILSTVLFDELLSNIFSKQVSGIDCVIETKDLFIRYTIQKGKPVLESM